MWQERLRDDLRLWRAHGQAKGYLLKGSPLTVAGDWLAQRRADLTSHEIAFIELSVRQRRRDNYVRIAVGAAVVGLLVIASLFVAATQRRAATDTSQALATAVASGVAAAATADYSEQRAVQSAAEAEEAREAAVANENLANARWLVAQAKALDDDDPQLGLALALEALALAQEIGSTDEILAEGRQTLRSGRELSLGHAVDGILTNEDGGLLFLMHEDKASYLWSIETDEILLSLPNATPSDVSFHVGGRIAVARLRNENGDLTGAELYDVRTGQRPGYIGDGRISDVEFFDDERFLLVDYEPEPGVLSGRVLFDLQNERRFDFIADGSIRGVGYYVEERYLLVELGDEGGNRTHAELYEVATGRRPDFAQDDETDFYHFTPGERILITVYIDEEGDYFFSELIDVRTGLRIDLVDVSRITYLDTFGGNNYMWVLYGDENGDTNRFELYDLQTGQRPEFVANERIIDIYFSEDDPFMAIDFADEGGNFTRSELIDIGTGRRLDFAVTGRIVNVEAYADGRFILVASEVENGGTDTMELYDVQTGRRPDFLPDRLIEEVDYYPEQHLLVVEFQEEEGKSNFQLYDVQSGRRPGYLPNERILDVNVHSDGRFIEVFYQAEDAETARLELIDSLTGHRFDFSRSGIWSVTLAPDGRLLRVEAARQEEEIVKVGIELLDIQTGQRPAFLEESPVGEVEFHARGRILEIAQGGFDIVYDAVSGSEIQRDDDLDVESLSGFGFIRTQGADRTSYLWRIWPQDTVQLVSLGSNLAETIYISATHQIVAHYLDGSTYLLNLDWLEAMARRREALGVEELPAADLIELACAYPLKDGLPPQSQDRLVEILAEIGRTPSGCDAFN
jgi:hypothetical protein